VKLGKRLLILNWRFTTVDLRLHRGPAAVTAFDSLVGEDSGHLGAMINPAGELMLFSNYGSGADAIARFHYAFTKVSD
jgi:hypothetical protein